MTEQFNNYAVDSLAAGCGSGDASITVTNGAALAATGNFRLLVDNELMLCTARSTNTLTVTRGIEGTTAASHLMGAQVIPLVTAGAIAQLKADILAAVGGVGGTPPTAITVTRLGGTSAASLVSGATVWRVFINVTTPFDSSAKLSLGSVSSPNLLVTNFDLTLLRGVAFDMIVPWGGSTQQAVATISSGSPTVGAAQVLIFGGLTQ